MKVLLSLGSNVGNRFAYLFEAKQNLKNKFKILASSAYMETSPIGPKQKNFINQIILIDTGLEPILLLDYLKDIEKKIGRRYREHWGPREIDIDILFYETKQIKTEKLSIPHKEIYNRAFIMLGILNIARKLDSSVFDTFDINENELILNSKEIKNQKVLML